MLNFLVASDSYFKTAQIPRTVSFREKMNKNTHIKRKIIKIGAVSKKY